MKKNKDEEAMHSTNWFKIILILLTLGIFGSVAGIAGYQGKMANHTTSARVQIGNYGVLNKNDISEISEVKTYTTYNSYDSNHAFAYFTFKGGSQWFAYYISNNETPNYNTSLDRLVSVAKMVQQALANKALDSQSISNILLIDSQDSALNDIKSSLGL